MILSIEYWMNALDHDSEAVSANLISTVHNRMDGPRFNQPKGYASFNRKHLF
jgi:hypothetical protein